MTLEWAGPILAAVTVATIWLGHVMVRKLNYHLGTRPLPVVALIGAAALAASLFATSDLLSGALGIAGITTLWDAFELVRQEERVRQGKARENPRRPVRRK
jgi:hypothetical protein